jgi:predicted enzyme related to lactoylglutathione lyase
MGHLRPGIFFPFSGAIVMPHPVVHWEIGAKDAAKQRAFYAQLFDWTTTVQPMMNYTTVDTGGGGINGGIMQSPANMPYVTFYVDVEDVQQYLDKAVGLGAKVAVPPTPIPGVGTFAFFLDLEGNVIGLFKK